MRGSWVDRFTLPIPIRCRGPLHFYRVIDSTSERPALLVLAPQIPAPEALSRLTNLARLHELLGRTHPTVPKLVDAQPSGALPWVVLDCDAVADLEQLTEFVLHGGEKPDFSRGAALGRTLMETLAVCHTVRDPANDRPVTLGSLAMSNVLFSASGQISLVGFGGGPLSNAYVAPEVASGAAPSPGADVYSLVLFMRALGGFCVLPPTVKRVFSGHAEPGDEALLRALLEANIRILAAPPVDRPSMEATLGDARAMWRALGFTPDREGFSAWVARALSDDGEPLAEAPAHERPPVIRISSDGELLEMPNGARHSLGRRRPLRRLLVALARAHRERSGAALTVDELLQAGWPGEDPLPEAGSNRVYVAISTMRKLGLGELLQRWDGGYRLDPTVRCQV